MGEQKIEHFTHIIIGGGIVGAGAFRDLCLHEESVLLLDKGDFNSQTSESSSKMLHGGIRYLENADFFLVKEALFEKNHWLKVAPHVATEDRFYLPIYRESKYPLWMLRIGLFLYDLLSWFKNTPHKVINKKKVTEAFPGIKEEGLKGAGIYSDGIVDDSKLGLECIYDGLLNPKARALNYHEVKSITGDQEYTVEVMDTISGVSKKFTCEHIITAVGPFTDQFMKQISFPWKPVMLLSKGTHLWLDTKSLPIEHPMVLQTNDQRIIFVIPQRSAILVGTTEMALPDDAEIFDITATDQEIQYLLDNVNHYFPNANISSNDILSTFAGVRPLVKSRGRSRGKTSRKHKIFSPKPNFLVITGGKYTTFRVMAQEVVKLAMKNLKRPYNKTLSLTPLRKISKVQDPIKLVFNKELLDQVVNEELPRTKEDLIKRRLSIISKDQLSQDQKGQLEIIEKKLS
jgi:glycerol-3-phosphate dehydrogenase